MEGVQVHSTGILQANLFSTSVMLPYTPLVNTLQHCGHVANERIIAVSKSQLRNLGQIVLGYVVLGKRRLEPQVVDQPKEDRQCSGGIELQSIKNSLLNERRQLANVPINRARRLLA